MREITIILLVLIALLLALAVANRFLKVSLAEYMKDLPERTAWGLWRWATAHEKSEPSINSTDTHEYILLEDLPNAHEDTPPARKRVSAGKPQSSHKARMGL